MIIAITVLVMYMLSVTVDSKSEKKNPRNCLLSESITRMLLLWVETMFSATFWGTVSFSYYTTQCRVRFALYVNVFESLEGNYFSVLQ